LDLEFYRRSNLDAAASKADAFTHFIASGLKDGCEPNEIFDVSWYNFVQRGTALGPDPITHYIKEGSARGLNPSPIFDTRWYRATYSGDLRDDENPLVHYLSKGASQGRIPSEAFGMVAGCNETELRTTVRKKIERLEEESPNFFRALSLMARDCAPPNLQQIARTLDIPRVQGKSDALVSVIMPVYNRVGLVCDAVESVLAQTHANLELLICDDGSSDGTVAALGRYNDERLTLLKSSTNRGAAAARNRCLEISKGAYISYLDSDNIWHPEFLSGILRSLLQSKSRIAYASYFDTVFDRGSYHCRSTRYREFNYRMQIDHPYIDLNSLVHDRMFLEVYGGFDENLVRLQDYDLIGRYARHHNPVHVPYPLNIYRRIPGEPQITSQYADHSRSWRMARRKAANYLTETGQRHHG
jgi:hypothetical protein